MTQNSVVAGIHLGNSYSSIAVFRKDKPEVIANQDGDRLIPTVVAFTDHEILTGTQAKQSQVRYAPTTIDSFLCFLGSKGLSFQDLHTKKLFWKHTFVDEQLCAVVQFDEEEEPKFISLKEILKYFLLGLAHSAETFIGSKISLLVLSIPTSLSKEQEKIIHDVAIEAGLPLQQIIRDPSAAFLSSSFMSSSTSQSDKNILSIGFGGSHFETNFLLLRSGILLSMGSFCLPLGGSAIDLEIQNVFLEELKKKKIHVEGSRPLIKLMSAAEQAKRNLTLSLMAPVFVESLFNGSDFSTTLQRHRLNILITDKILVSLMSSIKMFLSTEAPQNACKIHEVIVHGGASRVPKFQSLLKETFPSSLIKVEVDPDECLSFGAAIQAYTLRSSIHSSLPHHLKALPNDLHIIYESSDPLLIASAYSPAPFTKTLIIPIEASAQISTFKILERGEVFVEINLETIGSSFVSLTLTATEENNLELSMKPEKNPPTHYRI